MYNIKNCIYLGNVFHARLSPKQHKLNYIVFYLNINLKEINKKSSLNLLCLRGGLRSKIASKWLQEIGETIHPVEGGYKALRQTCMSLLEKPNKKFWIIR